MDIDINEYEEACRKNRKENEQYLEIFESELTEKGLSERTIRSHLNNVEFYINDFLVFSELIPMKDGCEYIYEFLGDFFIRKCMWSTPATIKSTAASLKKFYKCMVDHGKIKKEDYKELCETIKDSMEDWQDDCSRFNDTRQINPFSFF